MEFVGNGWKRRFILAVAALFLAYHMFSFYRPFIALNATEAALEAQLDSMVEAGAADLLSGERKPRERYAAAGLRNLTLAPSEGRLAQRLEAWRHHAPVIAAAKQVMAADEYFIPYYKNLFISLAVFAFVLAFLWPPPNPGAGLPIPREPTGIKLLNTLPHGSGGLVSLAIVIAAILVLVRFDRAENHCVITLLDGEARCKLDAMRFYAQMKFVLLWLVSLATLLVLIAGIRRSLRARKRQTPANGLLDPNHAGGSYRELLNREQQSILGLDADPLSGRDFTVEVSGELRVSRSREDLFGLALSGGGIRSATFNLGLLQGLHRFEMLGHVDYLSTVSGGGYIGGFWSRWLMEQQAAGAAGGGFPDVAKELRQNVGADSRVFETKEVRHIREFSKFLVPRIGIFDTETWGAAVAFLAALGPAIITALCILGLSLIAWLGLTFYLACPDTSTAFGWILPGKAIFLSGLTLLVFVVFEIWWQRAPTGATTARANFSVIWRSAVALLVITLLSGGGLSWLAGKLNFEPWQVWFLAIPKADLPGFWYSFRDIAAYENWWVLFGIVNGEPLANDTWIFIPRLYEPSLIWLLAAAFFMILRFKGVFAPSSIQRRVMIPTNDRVTMRLLGLATSSALVATFWHIGLNLSRLESLPFVLGGGAAGGAGLFALLRNWIGEKLKQPHKEGLWEKLKPYVPQILAYLTIGLAWAALASALIILNGDDWYRWYQAAFIMSLPVAWTLLVDPHEFGLHGAYRDRICRAYLGAALPSDSTAADNRRTDIGESDDVRIASLLPRPLHLVCCAANNLGGDHLSTLSRGARSAVVSRDGVAMGCGWISQPALQLGSALTASAAAANSNMGSVSMRVGPAVSFLMSALNLRLGIWVDNPDKVNYPRSDRLLPGWRYFKEMAALTDTSAGEIHLSDGGHFENLGLYELIRRHCRYIIVSDATADPDVAFDDFGNTVRRIREDFGIEIIIDIEPLKPEARGHARQHAAVGVIDYGIFDKGILIYIKSTLTGDEPPDIAQYKSRNAAFPHESTGDQFYDEAQWESYRRLAVHTVNEVFAFVEHIGAHEKRRPQKIFAEARRTWYPTPPGLNENLLQITARFARLEDDLKATTPLPLLAEVYPEIGYTVQQLVGPPAPPTPDQELANLTYIQSAMTLMEDTIAGCELQTHWQHPLNLGWVNCFARWATAPTFRRWWPLLKPMYGPALRAFLEDRFEVLRDDRLTASASVEPFTPTNQTLQFTYEWWQTRHEMPQFSDHQRLFGYYVHLPQLGYTPAIKLQVALVAVTANSAEAVWTSDDLFVPFCLWGSPLAVDFLEKLLVKLNASYTSCTVKVKGPGALENSLAKWEERQSFVEYYRAAGFRLTGTEPYSETLFGGTRRTGQVAILTLKFDERTSADATSA